MGKGIGYALSAHGYNGQAIQYTERRYQPKVTQSGFDGLEKLSIFELSGRVRKPSHNMYADIYARLQAMQDAHNASDPRMELDTLNAQLAYAVSSDVCARYILADGTLKRFKVEHNGKTVWRNVLESGDKIAGFDRDAHSWIMGIYGADKNVDDLNEQELFVNAMLDAYNLRRRINALKRTLKAETSNWQAKSERLNALINECIMHL